MTEIGVKLAKTIQASSLNCASFMENCNNRQAESTLTVNELKEAFFLLKIKALVMMTLVLMLSEIVLAPY